MAGTMKSSRLAVLLLAVLPFLAGCANFWQAPTSTTNSFALSSSGNISVTAGSAGGSTATITVTPANSFTGTVTLTCAVGAPANATNPATCSLSPTSVDITGTSALTSVLTVTASSSTTAGAYTITVTGTSGSTTQTTSVCAEVSSSGSATCGSTAATTSGNFYVLSNSAVAGYTVGSGALAAISGTSYNLAGATAIAIAPTGNFLYISSEGSGIVVYTINASTGALTQGTEIIADSAVGAMQIDPSGKWLLDANLAGTLTAYPITSTGAQDTTRTLQQVALAGATVQQMAVSANGDLISVALGAKGTQSFPFTAASNTPIGSAYSPVTAPYGADGAAISVAFDPLSRLLYIGETAAFNSSTNSGALRVFAIGANTLTELNYNAPYAPLGTGPHAILPSSTGSYVYVASWQSGNPGVITGYSVATSALTQIGSTVDTGTEPTGLAEDNTGTYVFAVSNQGNPLFDAYTLSATTAGQLDAYAAGSTISTPIAIVAAP
jgi:hypothetical protein